MNLASYRLYCLDGAGKIMTAEWLEADSDAAALDQARQREQPLACEVWDRERLVGRIEPYRD
jgi:hypothetical protein